MKYPYVKEDIKEMYSQEVISAELEKRKEILDFSFDFQKNGKIASTKYLITMYKDSDILAHLFNLLRKLIYVPGYEKSEELINRINDAILKLLSLKTTLVNRYIFAPDREKHTLLSYAMKYGMYSLVNGLLQRIDLDINQKCYLYGSAFLAESFPEYAVNPVLVYFNPLDNDAMLKGETLKLLKHPNLELTPEEINNIFQAVKYDSLEEGKEHECFAKREEILNHILSDMTNKLNKLFNDIEKAKAEMVYKLGKF